jgi:DNA-binding IclR family transcriptional regulator
MPCVSADGKPTPSAKKLLESLKDKSLSPEDLATFVDQPLFRVRSSLRELVAAGWIQESEGRYGLTEQGARLGLDTEK